MSDSWDPAKFNWRSVLTAARFSPRLATIWVFGVGCGLLAGPVPVGLVILGALALVVLAEWLHVVVKAAVREAQRADAYNYYNEGSR